MAGIRNFDARVTGLGPECGNEALPGAPLDKKIVAQLISCAIFFSYEEKNQAVNEEAGAFRARKSEPAPDNEDSEEHQDLESATRQMIPHKKEIEVLRRILFSAASQELELLKREFEANLAGELELGCEIDQEAVDYLDWLLRRRELF